MKFLNGLFQDLKYKTISERVTYLQPKTENHLCRNEKELNDVCDFPDRKYHKCAMGTENSEGRRDG